MHTQFRFWGGLDTIGGNIIEIRHGNDRVICDFGRAYNPADTIFSQASRDSQTPAMLRLGVIPPIDGVYTQADIAKAKLDILSAEDATYNTAVFVSHLHLDHVGSLDALAPGIPVYMSTESKFFYGLLHQIGEQPNKPVSEITAFDYETPVRIGNITVTGYPTDHDVYGNTALLIETPDGRFVHSGDIRMRGSRPELNHAFIDTMRDQQVDYLLMEGTSFFPKSDTIPSAPVVATISENDLADQFTKIIKAHTGVAFMNSTHRNPDRLANILKAAAQTGRVAVFEPKTSVLVSALFPDATFQVLTDDDTGDYMAALRQKYTFTTISTIAANPSGYIVQNSFEHIFLLLEHEVTDAVYIHTNGVPLGPFDPAYGSMQSFLDKLGIAFASTQLSGHGSQTEILAIVDRIKPKTLVPWHSLAPETMVPNDPNQQVLLPTLNHWFDLREV